MKDKLLIADEDHRFVYALGPNGSNRFWFRVDAAGPEKVSHQEAVEITQYVVTAANMLPELLDMIDKLAGKIEKIHFDSNEDDLYAEELMLKADELLNRIKT